MCPVYIYLMRLFLINRLFFSSMTFLKKIYFFLSHNCLFLFHVLPFLFYWCYFLLYLWEFWIYFKVFFQIIISISIDVYSDFLDFPPSTSLDIPFGFSIPRTFHKWLNCKGAETVNWTSHRQSNLQLTFCPWMEAADWAILMHLWANWFLVSSRNWSVWNTTEKRGIFYSKDIWWHNDWLSSRNPCLPNIFPILSNMCMHV